MKADDSNAVLQKQGADQLRGQWDQATDFGSQLEPPKAIDPALGKNSQTNIKAFLREIGVSLKYNSFSRQPTIQRSGMPRVALTDDIISELWLAADDRGAKSGRMFFEEVVRDVARQTSFHPVRDYLDGLRWDGKPRLDTWLIQHAGADEAPLVRTMFRKTMIAAVRRVRQPGCKFDVLLVFEGPQGAGKSSIVSILGGEWTNDCLLIGDDPKVVIEQTQNVWLAELSELPQGKREIETMKAMISRQTDKARVAYAKIADAVPRQFIMIATVNMTQYLTDQTGNRRFWPIPIERVNLQQLVADRDQLWAEAAALEATGEPLELPPELRTLAAAEQEQRVQTDPWEDALLERIGGRTGYFTMQEALRVMGVEMPQQGGPNTKRMHAILHKTGFRLCRPASPGRRARVYCNQLEGEKLVHLSLSG